MAQYFSYVTFAYLSNVKTVLSGSRLSAFMICHTGRNTNEGIMTFGHSLLISMKSFDIRIKYWTMKVNVTRMFIAILQYYVMKKEGKKYTIMLNPMWNQVARDWKYRHILNMFWGCILLLFGTLERSYEDTVDYIKVYKISRYIRYYHMSLWYR